MKNMIPETDLNTVSGGTVYENNATYHLVVAGDTLGAIAMMYGTTVKHLLALNPRIKNANLIYVGEMIRIW